jgi:hypothetical protein
MKIAKAAKVANGVRGLAVLLAVGHVSAEIASDCLEVPYVMTRGPVLSQPPVGKAAKVAKPTWQPWQSISHWRLPFWQPERKPFP